MRNPQPIALARPASTAAPRGTFVLDRVRGPGPSRPTTIRADLSGGRVDGSSRCASAVEGIAVAEIDTTIGAQARSWRQTARSIAANCRGVVDTWTQHIP